MFIKVMKSVNTVSCGIGVTTTQDMGVCDIGQLLLHLQKQRCQKIQNTVPKETGDTMYQKVMCRKMVTPRYKM